MNPTDTYLLAQEKLGANMDGIAEQLRVKAAADARIAEYVEDSRHQVDLMGKNPFNDRILRSELAAAARMSPRGADVLINRSYVLVNELPATLDALREGEIFWQHASVIIQQATTLPPEVLPEFEQKVLPVAETASPSKTDKAAARLREKLNPESMTERRKSAFEERHIRVTPTADGMAELTALLPVEQATAIYTKVTEIARGLRCPEDERTMPQLRADVFADGLINAGVEASVGAGAGIVAKVWVTVPVMTLLGHEDTTARLEGAIPIAPDVARELAAHAPSFTRILTHPETGALLSYGQDTYKPPEDLQNYIRMRDGTCRSPWNCSCGARFTDLDHTIPFSQGGSTDAENLACLCPSDHRLKHNSDWDVAQLGDGILEWTAPSGRTYITRPQADLGF